MKNTALATGGVVFAVIGILQFLRWITGWEVLLEGTAVPLWLSGVASLAALGLAAWMFIARSKP